MTAVHQVFTIRSFRSAKDRDFLRALLIYDAHTHPQVKTDSREIADWLERGSSRSDAKFYVCGLFISGALVGFAEFIYLKKDRLIHFDYFVIDAERRTAGAFYTFAEEMRVFFAAEKLEWDFITAEVADIDPVNGVSRQAQRLIRLFRQIGFCEVLADYRQPLLGIRQADTVIKATLLTLPRVEMETISKSRFMDIVAAIYRKHYIEWYSIYSDSAAEYRARIEQLLVTLEKQLEGKTEIQLRGPEYDFSDGTTSEGPPFREVLPYLAKIAASGVAAAGLPILIRHYAAVPTTWLIGVPACIFVLLAVTISLTDKKRFEAFKLLISLVSRLFDR